MSFKPQYRPVRDIKNYHFHHPGEVCAPALVGYACIERERMKNKQTDWDQSYRDQLNSIVHCGVLNFIDIGPAERKLKKKYPNLVQKHLVEQDDSNGQVREQSQRQKSIQIKNDQKQQKEQESQIQKQLQVLKEEEERIKIIAQIEAQNLIDKEKHDQEEFNKIFDFAGDDQYYVQQRQLMFNFEQQYKQKAQQEEEQRLLKQKTEAIPPTQHLQWPQYDPHQQIQMNQQFQEYDGNNYINVSQINLGKAQYNQIEKNISSIKEIDYSQAIYINEDIQVKILPNNSRIIQEVKECRLRTIDGQRFREYSNVELSDQTISEMYMFVCDQAADENQKNNVYYVGNMIFEICADGIINIKLLEESPKKQSKKKKDKKQQK